MASAVEKKKYKKQKNTKTKKNPKLKTSMHLFCGRYCIKKEANLTITDARTHKMH